MMKLTPSFHLLRQGFIFHFYRKYNKFIKKKALGTKDYNLQ